MTPTPRIYALIVAAGVGARAGGEVPKQYQKIAGRAMLTHSAAALASHPAIAGVQVVIHPEHGEYYAKAAQGLALLPPVHGGAERSDSVRAGLAALAAHGPDYVLIHDAARPFISHRLIDTIIAALAPETGVVPAIAVADTVRRLQQGAWHDVAREGLMRIQTPQAFAFEPLKKLYASHASATDDAAIWLAAGHKLAYVPGHEELRKVTTAEDVQWANDKAGARRIAIGMGYDVHELIPSGEAGVIRLGGIDIVHGHKLHGHSDADVVLHAVVDALLGGIAAGDIGSFFPPTDARWKGANSSIFIEEARSQVAARGGEISHLDITIIGEKPKISLHRDSMRASIAQLLHVPIARVSVKATTTEKLGFEGREEGIACQAVATLSLPAEAA